MIIQFLLEDYSVQATPHTWTRGQGQEEVYPFCDGDKDKYGNGHGCGHGSGYGHIDGGSWGRGGSVGCGSGNSGCGYGHTKPMQVYSVE